MRNLRILEYHQDFFGDLTTISLGYSQGSDVVGKRGEPEFAADTGKRRHFRVESVSARFLTKDSILGAFLGNHYRSR